MRTKTRLRFADLPKDYAGLCALLPPRPIHDAVDYANVSDVTEVMVLWQDELTSDQRDYFDLLCSLLEDYDTTHTKWPRSAGAERRAEAGAAGGTGMGFRTLDRGRRGPQDGTRKAGIVRCPPNPNNQTTSSLPV